MKIVVLKSSGNTHGSSNMLADEFIRGAKESGHTVTEIDVFHAGLNETELYKELGILTKEKERWKESIP